MKETQQYLTHENPVWREKADFIIHAMVDSEDKILRFEQLWVRRINSGENNFEICCIPFFLYNLSLGDKVRTKARHGKKYIFQEVIERSGHQTFRIWFNKKDEDRFQIINELKEMGCLLEWQTPKGSLLAIDVSSNELGGKVAHYLFEKEQQGLLIYETGEQ